MRSRITSGSGRRNPKRRSQRTQIQPALLVSPREARRLPHYPAQSCRAGFFWRWYPQCNLQPGRSGGIRTSICCAALITSRQCLVAATSGRGW